MSFGETIKRLRKLRNLTQDEVGKLAGINGRNVSRYENGHLPPSRKTVERFAQAFAVTPEELMTGQGQTPMIVINDGELLNLFQEVSALPEHDKTAVKRILAIVVKQNRLQQMIAS